MGACIWISGHFFFSESPVILLAGISFYNIKKVIESLYIIEILAMDMKYGDAFQ